VYDQNIKLDSRVEDRVGELDFSLAGAQSELQQVRKESVHA